MNTVTNPRVKAYSYLRFSTPEQLKGDSFRRQTSMAEAYAAENNLDLDDKLTFHDLGVSGFRGKNVKAGKLAEFLEAVRTGLIEPKSSGGCNRRKRGTCPRLQHQPLNDHAHEGKRPHEQHRTNERKGAHTPLFEHKEYQPFASPRKRLVARFTGSFADQTRPRNTVTQSSFYDFGNALILLLF